MDIVVVDRSSGIPASQVLWDGQYLEINLDGDGTLNWLYGHTYPPVFLVIVNRMTGRSRVWTATPPHEMICERTYLLPLRMFSSSFVMSVPQDAVPLSDVFWTLRVDV